MISEVIEKTKIIRYITICKSNGSEIDRIDTKGTDMNSIKRRIGLFSLGVISKQHEQTFRNIKMNNILLIYDKIYYELNKTL